MGVCILCAYVFLIYFCGRCEWWTNRSMLKALWNIYAQHCGYLVEVNAKWVYEWVSAWVSVWMSEWVSVCVCDSVSEISLVACSSWAGTKKRKQDVKLLKRRRGEKEESEREKVEKANLLLSCAQTRATKSAVRPVPLSLSPSSSLRVPLGLPVSKWKTN